jgi:hypothetical protein
MSQPPQDHGPTLTDDAVGILISIARFGPIQPITQADIGLIEGLQTAGFVAKDPNNPEYCLTVRGWAFVRKTIGKGE